MNTLEKHLGHSWGTTKLWNREAERVGTSISHSKDIKCFQNINRSKSHGQGNCKLAYKYRILQ